MLLDNGADADFHSHGYSLLHYALTDGRYDSVKALLAHGAADSDNDAEETNLMLAMQLPPDCPSRTLIVKALLPELPDVPSIPVFWHRSKDEMCCAPLPETEDKTEWREVARIMVYEETLQDSICDAAAMNYGRHRMSSYEGMLLVWAIDGTFVYGDANWFNFVARFVGGAQNTLRSFHGRGFCRL